MEFWDSQQWTQHPIWLHFTDENIEHRFRYNYESGAIGFIRAAMVMSMLSWIAAMAVGWLVIPEQILAASLVIGVIMFPYLIFVLYATWQDYFRGKLQSLAAGSNALAGLVLIYFCGFFPNSEYVTLLALTYLMFFGAYMLHLRLIPAIGAAAVYAIGFQIYMVGFAEIPVETVAVLSFTLWATGIVLLLGGYITERGNRKLYVQQETIKEQKAIITAEKEQSERLLLNVLPESIADRLKDGESIISDRFGSVSVLFADIVGFTELSRTLEPEALVTLLNDIFGRFDRLVSESELEKIKTIGDAYMVAGGLPDPIEGHCEKMLQFGQAMFVDLGAFNAEHDLNLDIRVGIHTGSVVAGVIGSIKFIYDIWGDTVNFASRMESHGVPGAIHVSNEFRGQVSSDVQFTDRGIIEIKGIGETKTFLLEIQD